MKLAQSDIDLLVYWTSITKESPYTNLVYKNYIDKVNYIRTYG